MFPLNVTNFQHQECYFHFNLAKKFFFSIDVNVPVFRLNRLFRLLNNRFLDNRGRLTARILTPFKCPGSLKKQQQPEVSFNSPFNLLLFPNRTETARPENHRLSPRTFLDDPELRRDDRQRLGQDVRRRAERVRRRLFPGLRR